jgi:hypothetical protein
VYPWSVSKQIKGLGSRCRVHGIPGMKNFNRKPYTVLLYDALMVDQDRCYLLDRNGKNELTYTVAL